MIAAQFHDLFTSMMFGAVGAGLNLLFALFVPRNSGAQIFGHRNQGARLGELAKWID
jgi:hypothetical protein